MVNAWHVAISLMYMMTMMMMMIYALFGILFIQNRRCICQPYIVAMARASRLCTGAIYYSFHMYR